MDKSKAALMLASSSIKNVVKVLMTPSETRGRITLLSGKSGTTERKEILEAAFGVLYPLEMNLRKKDVSSKSSIGHIETDQWSVVVKPSVITSSGFSAVQRGKDNENKLKIAIDHALLVYEEPINVKFVSNKKTFVVEDVIKVDLDNSKRKSDVTLTSVNGRKMGISIKSSENFKWDSGERKFEKHFRKLLMDSLKSKRFKISPPANSGSTWSINPAAVRKMPRSDSYLAIFGENSRPGQSIVVIQNFSPSNFSLDGESGELTVEAISIFSNINEVPEKSLPVFLIRNDDSRNTYTGEFRGLRFEISPANVGRKHIII